MSNTHVVPYLARRVRGVAAQESLLSTHPEVVEFLAANSDLDDSVWFKLTKKTKAPVVVALASGKIDVPRLEEILKDKRMTVRNALFQEGLKGCTEEMADMVINAGWLSREQASMWLRSKSVPVTRIRQVAIIESGSYLLHCLADTAMFSDKEAAELMVDKRNSMHRSAIHRLLDQRPALIPAALAAGMERSFLVEAAVGSRHLFDREAFEGVMEAAEQSGRFSSGYVEVLITLLANPNTPVDIVDKVLNIPALSKLNTWNRWRPGSNAYIFTQVGRRRILNKNRSSITAPWETYDGEDRTFIFNEATKLLGHNRYPTLLDWFRGAQNGKQGAAPSVPSRQVEQTTRPLTVQEHSTSTVLLSEPGAQFKITREIVNEIHDRIDVHGNAGWTTFWSLVDTWQGTLAELLDTTVDLSA